MPGAEVRISLGAGLLEEDRNALVERRDLGAQPVAEARPEVPERALQRVGRGGLGGGRVFLCCLVPGDGRAHVAVRLAPGR